MYKNFFLLFIHGFIISLCAQDLPIGQFKEYLPYNTFNWVAQDKENIYAATNQSILVVDKRDSSREKWSKLNGLSEVGIQMIYSDQNDRLFIAYTNSNIDIVKDYKVYNIRDILNKQITGSKVINNICAYGDLAYFSCDFGVVIIDLKTYLVKDTWVTIKQNEPYKAHFLTIHNDKFYLATDKGIFSISTAASNPADFMKWTLESKLSRSSYKLLCSYQDKLFAVREGIGSVRDSLFVYEDSMWSYRVMNNFYRNFEVRNGKMLVCDYDHVKVFTGNTYTWYNWLQTNKSGVCATFDEKMNIWVADDVAGLIHINTANKNFDVISAEGPVNSYAYSLCFADGILAVVPGIRGSAIGPDQTYPAVSVLKDNKWWRRNDFKPYQRVNGLNSIAINPKNKDEIYVASWRGGLFKMNIVTDTLIPYNHYNSPLKTDRVDSAIFVSGLAIDKNNNLWMANTASTDLVKILNLETNVWYSVNIGFPNAYAEHILIDSRDYKWVTLPQQNRLVVLKGGPGNIEISKYGVDLTSQANVAGNRTTCIAEDREGRIWVGCDQGIKVIYDAASVFNSTVYAKNILLEQVIGDTSYVQNLLESEYITCIAVDAANRKWIGTRSAGAFLVSPTGTEELLHFTTHNSPLFSNQINDIKINPENGEVFIATERGLISYKGTATTGKENYKEVLVYPNPVHEGYTGPIAVKGLMEDSFCKITDAAGNLIWQGYAYGGQLIWNGKDFYGNRPATGVYFIMASSKNGKEKKVAKLLFIQ